MVRDVKSKRDEKTRVAVVTVGDGDERISTLCSDQMDAHEMVWDVHDDWSLLFPIVIVIVTHFKNWWNKRRWRKEFGPDSIVEEDLGFKELEGVVASVSHRLGKFVLQVVGVEFDKGSNGSLHATPCLVLSRKAVDGCMARIAPRLWMAIVGTIALIQVHKFPRSQYWKFGKEQFRGLLQKFAISVVAIQNAEIYISSIGFLFYDWRLQDDGWSGGLKFTAME
ncbi:hypothetical protein L1987_85103 [Smallanthus sonchifolius]|uniref:Uncharacterized protein n=1 Tax=Smallanthus sonchifolius TaxID=185202 RepID=A0ACB8XW87_9ASTR|nr:hypothetical protein L1987_85103 [Smallanthus sonchifolius]